MVPQERPRAAKSGPRAAQEKAKSAQERPKSGLEQPKSSQERPRAAKSDPRATKSSQEHPKTTPNDPKSGLGPPKFAPHRQKQPLQPAIPATINPTTSSLSNPATTTYQLCNMMRCLRTCCDLLHQPNNQQPWQTANNNLAILAT